MLAGRVDLCPANLDRVLNQGRPPFDPRAAVTRFVAELKAFSVQTATGDRYAGETFRRDFERKGISNRCSEHTAHELYEAFEPWLNAQPGRLIRRARAGAAVPRLDLEGRAHHASQRRTR
jgi:hypothetical protein